MGYPDNGASGLQTEIQAAYSLCTEETRRDCARRDESLSFVQFENKGTRKLSGKIAELEVFRGNTPKNVAI